MKALVIGTAKSIWVKEFIKNVLLPEGIEVTLLTDPTTEHGFSGFYESNGVKPVGTYQPSPLLSRIPKLKRIYKEAKTRASLSRLNEFYDVIFIISTVPFYVKCAYEVWKNGSKVYAIFIGSDILRAGPTMAVRTMSKLATMNAQVVATSKKIEDACCQYLQEGMQKPLTIDFGSTQLDTIDACTMAGKHVCKTALGLAPDSLTICVGHNGFSSQQHLKIIEAIDALPKSIRERISLILPMTYGGKKSYTDEVKRVAKAFPCVIFDRFMEEKDVARLRVASDYYVNAQTTDALSTSMLEHIYAGSKVFVGSWLSYPELKEWGIKINEFQDFGELTELMQNMMTKSTEDEQEQEKNKNTIHSYSSWDTCREKWKKELF